MTEIETQISLDLIKAKLQTTLKERKDKSKIVRRHNHRHQNGSQGKIPSNQKQKGFRFVDFRSQQNRTKQSTKQR